MKKFLAGFLAAAIIFASGTVLASTKTIEVFYNNIKLIVNGKTITTDEEPFIKGGRTMCPARFVAEALGAEVSFSETDNAVIVKSKIDGTKSYTSSTFNGMKTVIMEDDIYLSMQDILTNKDKVIEWVQSYLPETANGGTNGTGGNTTMEILKTPDGITNIDTWEGKKYIGFSYIQQKIKVTGYDLVHDSKSDKWYLVRPNPQKRFEGSLDAKDTIILGDLPMIMTYGYGSLEFNYYVNTILPLIK